MLFADLVPSDGGSVLLLIIDCNIRGYWFGILAVVLVMVTKRGSGGFGGRICKKLFEMSKSFFLVDVIRVLCKLRGRIKKEYH